MSNRKSRWNPSRILPRSRSSSEGTPIAKLAEGSPDPVSVAGLVPTSQKRLVGFIRPAGHHAEGHQQYANPRRRYIGRTLLFLAVGERGEHFLTVLGWYFGRAFCKLCASIVPPWVDR